MEEEDLRLKSEYEACLVEEERLKYEQEEQARLKEEEEECLVEDARQEAKEHWHAQLRIEEGVCLTLEARRRAEEEDLGLKAKEARLEYEAENQAHLKAEEDYQISDEASLEAK